MKGFTREDVRFSLCRLNCCLCSIHLGGYCPGCGDGAGNQNCAIARCSLEHGSIAPKPSTLSTGGCAPLYPAI